MACTQGVVIPGGSGTDPTAVTGDAHIVLDLLQVASTATYIVNASAVLRIVGSSTGTHSQVVSAGSTVEVS